MSIPNRMLLLITGNNMSIQGDMVRRVPICRIDPGTDVPASREFAFCPKKYVKDNREKMVVAVLTVIRGWFSSEEYANGQKAKGGAGSFEVWESIVRQPIAWLANSLGRDDLDDVMNAFKNGHENDPEAEILRDLFNGATRRFGGEKFTAKELLAHAKMDVDLMELFDDAFGGKTEMTSRRLGQVLKNRKDRVASGLKLVFEANKKKGNVFQIVNADGSLLDIKADDPMEAAREKTAQIQAKKEAKKKEEEAKKPVITEEEKARRAEAETARLARVAVNKENAAIARAKRTKG